MKIGIYLKSVLFSPETFFAKDRQKDSIFSHQIIKTFLIFLIIWVVALSGTKIIHEIFAYNLEIKIQDSPSETAVVDKKLEGFRALETLTIVSSKALYAVIWLLIPLTFTTIRFSLLKLIDETKVKFSDFFSVTLTTSLPLIIFSGIISAMFDMATVFSFFREKTGAVILFSTAGLMLFTGWLWEARLCLRAYKGLYQLLNGKSLLIWISPSLIFINILALLIISSVWFR